MNIVISDPKTGKAYSKKTEEPVFLNKKINESVDLGTIGLVGFKGKITGGSDKQGFPMRATIEGPDCPSEYCFNRLWSRKLG